MKIDENALIFESPPRGRWAAFLARRRENAKLAWEDWNRARLREIARRRMEEDLKRHPSRSTLHNVATVDMRLFGDDFAIKKEATK